MERLTEYFELGAYTDKRNNIIDVSDKLPLYENGVIMGKPIDRLAEFEDFMEEQGFESLEDLKNALLIKLPEEKVKEIAREEMRKEIKNNIAQILQKEVPELYKYKDRWDKLKEWAEYLCYFELVDKMQELEKGE